LIFKIGKCKGKKNLGNSYTRVILTEIYHLLGMKSSRDDLIDRMKTGWGCFVLASRNRPMPEREARARTFKCVWGSGIDAKE
jgi:hypothetical protein